MANTRKSHERSEEHTSELQSPCNLVCRLLLEKKQCSILTRHRKLYTLTRSGYRIIYCTPIINCNRWNTMNSSCVNSTGLFFFLEKRTPPGSTLLPITALFN